MPAELQAPWDELQSSFLSLSPLTYAILRFEQPPLQREHPEIIIDAIKALVEQVRT
jgi:hypothetical protein